MGVREVSEIRWFTDSPYAGEPECICSYCGERIEASDAELEDLSLEDEDAGEPIRMWNQSAKPTLEARFHVSCFRAALERGLVSLK